MRGHLEMRFWMGELLVLLGGYPVNVTVDFFRVLISI